MAEVAWRTAATKESQESLEFSESESRSDHKNEVTRKPVAHQNSGNSGNSKAGGKKLHNLHTSPAAVSHLEKVYSIVRQIYGRSLTDDLNDFNKNIAFWVHIF